MLKLNYHPRVLIARVTKPNQHALEKRVCMIIVVPEISAICDLSVHVSVVHS